MPENSCRDASAGSSVELGAVAFARGAEPPVPRDMERGAWRAMCLLLTFVWLAEFLPSEPFLTDFLLSKGLTKEQLDGGLFSLWIYVRMPSLLIVGVLAEYVGSANMLLIGATFGSTTVFVTRFCSSLFLLQCTQITVAISMAGHAGALYAVMFELSTFLGSSYQKHVHFVVVATLTSNFAAGIVGSTMRSTFAAPYTRVWEVSLCAQLTSVVVAAMLCVVVRELQQKARTASPASSNFSRLLWRDTCKSFRLRGVAEWTIWAIAMHTVHVVVATYWQLLLHAKTKKQEDLNGYANAASYLLGGAVLVLTVKASILSDRGARWWLIASSLTGSGLLVFAMGWAPSMWQLYGAYVGYQLVFRLSAAVATQQVGAEVKETASTESMRAAERASASSLEGILMLNASHPIGGSTSTIGAAPIPDATPLRPRLALVISATQVLGSCGALAAQSTFRHVHGRTSSGRLSMVARFELLGLGLCCAAVLFVTGRTVAALRRDRQ